MQVQIISPSDAERQFRMNVTRLGYQQVLQAVSDIKYDRENIAEDLLAGANELLVKLQAKKEEVKRPYLDVNKKIDEAFNSLYNPLNQLVQQKAAERKRIIKEINDENAAIEAEKHRKEALQKKINDYLQKWADIASSATTKASLDKLEAQINLAMGRPLEFKEMHEPFIQHCKAIKLVIQSQKEKVSQLDNILVEKSKAFSENNVTEYQKALEKESEINQELRQKQDEAVQAAFEMVKDATELQLTTPTVKPSRKQWRWEVTDMKKLAKHQPDLVSVVPNEVEIRALLQKIKENKYNKMRGECVMEGIRFFIDESYK